MSLFDTRSHEQAISPGDLEMLTQTLESWCRLEKIPRGEAEPQARVLLDTYKSGKRAQIDLIDALVAFKH